jgi:SCP-2 sterol transfer family protein
VRYLSDEWFVAADKALADDESLRAPLADVRLSVEQTVTDAPDGVTAGGTVSWALVIDRGTARLVVGPAPDADVRFRTSYRVASDIARGRLGAPAAFLRGDLSVGGDLNLLTTHQRAWAAVDDVLAEVRRATEHD